MKRKKEKSKILKEINKILYTYGLNKVIRYGQERKEVYQTQSVAEHVTNMIFCAYYFRDIEDPKHKIDLERVVRLIIMHDMGEIETGDIITNRKTEADSKKELIAIKQVAKKSPDFVRREIKDNFNRFENPKTREEKFAKAIDKFEGLLFWFPDDGIKMIKTIAANPVIVKYFEKLEKKIEELGFPSVLEYVKVMKEDMTKRGLLA
jgi:5'-deoxynucleotidase YfbR-like HD superfamily hydrolase